MPCKSRGLGGLGEEVVLHRHANRVGTVCEGSWKWVRSLACFCLAKATAVCRDILVERDRQIQAEIALVSSGTAQPLVLHSQIDH